jgi:hypothetical protein
MAELCVTTGSFEKHVKLHFQQPHAAALNGFLVEERGHTKSVYAENGTLFLQIDGHRWDLVQNNVKIRWKRVTAKKNRVKVEASGKIIFREDYPSALADPVNANDPTFDGMDEEAFDFWLWLFRCAGDPKWQNGVLNLWTKGFKYGGV